MEENVRTIKRHMKDHGIAARDKYTTISDEELDLVCAGILQNFPTIGIGLLYHLLSHLLIATKNC